MSSHGLGLPVDFRSPSIMACKCFSEFTQSFDLQVHLQTRTITASEYISPYTWSRPLSARPNLLNHYLQVHLQTRSITASECISKLTPTRPVSSHGHDLQVYLPTRIMIMASKYIFKERWWLYRDKGVPEVDRVMGSIYLADPGVDRHHLISISSYHTMKLHTLSFSTFGLTSSVRHFVDWRNCVDPQRLVVAYILTRFLCSSNQNRSYELSLDVARGAAECWWRALCLLAPLFHHNGLQVVHLWVFCMGVSRCSSDDARVPSVARLNVCIYIERLK